MLAHDDLTFSVIGATMESPWQQPPTLLAFISWVLAAIKQNCSDGTPVGLIVSHSRRGWFGWQHAHFSSGPLRSVKGCSTASLFLWSTPRKEGLWKIGGFYEKLVAVSHPNNQKQEFNSSSNEFISTEITSCLYNSVKIGMFCFMAEGQFSLFSHFNVHMLFCCGL